MSRSRSLPPNLRERPFGVAEGRAHGLTPGRLRGSDLARPFHGVRAAEAPTTHLDECRAYAARMRATEYFSHASALRAHALPLPWRLERGPIHVTAVLPEGRPRGVGVHGHSIAPSLARVVTVRGLEVSHPVQAWCELATTLTLSELVAVGDALVRRQQPLATFEELTDAVHRWRGRRGCAALSKALALIRPRTDSWEETMLRLDLLTAGLPEPEVNGRSAANGASSSPTATWSSGLTKSSRSTTVSSTASTPRSTAEMPIGWTTSLAWAGALSASPRCTVVRHGPIGSTVFAPL